mgnify:CR=1 FL=1
MKSIVSYPERGTGGNNTYRGNFSPKFVEDILNFFKPDSVGDYTVGSGTTLDVCKTHNIPCIGTDLNPVYGGVNLLKDDLPPVNMGGYSKMPTLIILHPPYPQKMVLYSVDNSPQLKQGDSWFILPSILVQSHKLIPYALRQVNSLFLILRLGY